MTYRSGTAPPRWPLVQLADSRPPPQSGTMQGQAFSLPRRAVGLGLAGLIPQLAALAIALGGGLDDHWIAVAAGYGYAALIFSFLGGLWWGIALVRPDAPRWLFYVAVLPSLIAFATFVPWLWGQGVPRGSLFVLALCLFASPLVDRVVARRLGLPAEWLVLRFALSAGLGVTTAVLGLA